MIVLICYKQILLLVITIIDPVDHSNNMLQKGTMQVEALEKLTLKEVEVWKNEFMKDVSMVCSVFGNVNREQALRYAASIKRKFLERAAIFKEVGLTLLL